MNRYLGFAESHKGIIDRFTAWRIAMRWRVTNIVSSSSRKVMSMELEFVKTWENNASIQRHLGCRRHAMLAAIFSSTFRKDEHPAYCGGRFYIFYLPQNKVVEDVLLGAHIDI